MAVFPVEGRSTLVGFVHGEDHFRVSMVPHVCLALQSRALGSSYTTWSYLPLLSSVWQTGVSNAQANR